MRRVGVGKDGREELVPCAVRRPASVPLVHGLPLPEAHTQIPPRHPSPIPVQDPVDDPTVASPTAAALPGLRQMRLQPDPLLVREISPPHEHANQRISRKSHDPPDRPKTVIRRYGRTLPPRDHWPGMPRHARLADGDQIAGETAAVDLVLAPLRHRPRRTGFFPARRRRHGAAGVRAGEQRGHCWTPASPWTGGRSRRLAGLAWMESVSMSEPVAVAVRALAGDGADRLALLPQEERVTYRYPAGGRGRGRWRW